MKWQFLDAGLSGFGIGFPDVPQTAIAMASIADFRGELLQTETAEMEAMAETRQLGYSSGRHCAHLAQAMLGLEVQAIGREARVPLWPAHSVGSITHSPGIAGAISSTSCRGVGIDLEQRGRVSVKLHATLFTQAERSRLGVNGAAAADIMFSAKEAGYKAVYPLVGRYIGFQEAEIHLDIAEGTFTIDYVGDYSPNRALNTGLGYWRVHADHVLTVFMIP